jgi:hypothetical protein
MRFARCTSLSHILLRFTPQNIAYTKLKFFYSGDENWPTDIPRIGKEAEKGCVGCGWYDIQKWRDSLNELIEKSQK